MKLSRIGELALLEQIRKSFGRRSRGLVVGIGDDAAVIKPLNKNLLITTDMMVEGVHFTLQFATPYQIGFKLVSVNVSDIYAMGGTPYYLLLNAALRKNTDKKFLDEFFGGVRDAMNLYGTVLIGGDLSGTHTGISLSATLIGYAERHIKRSGAKGGDRIYVTGNLGDSACGLELLKRIKKPVQTVRVKAQGAKNMELRLKNQTRVPYIPGGSTGKLSWNTLEPLLRRHLMPAARNTRKFAGYATSMIDVSDGLLIDLTRLCDESKVGARIYAVKIPVSREMEKASSVLGLQSMDLALSGGEDYEILFTAPPEEKVEAVHIGDVTESGRFIVEGSGRERKFSADGYQHFGRLQS
jgi:thiamine-monophosphate kinase